MKELLDGICSNDKEQTFAMKVYTATEIKVCTMTFQSSEPGLPPTEVINARPQPNNESNDFIIDMEFNFSKAMTSANVNPSSFLNYVVDGVSCESNHFCKSICDFLSYKNNHLGSTDTNHNMKSWRHKIIGGGGDLDISIEKLMIDIDLL